MKENSVKILMISIFITFGFLFCTHDNNTEIECSNEAIAIVKKYGEVNEGDCGYFFQIGDSLYKPVEIPKEFQQIGISVYIEYSPLDSIFYCGDLSQPPYQEAMKWILVCDIKSSKK